MRFAPLAYLLILASPAGADCVSRLDIERGIEARFDDGGRALMRREIGGTVRIDEIPAGGGPVIRSLLARGLWEFRSFDLGPDGWPVEGSRLETLYPVEPGRLPEPRAGLEWTGWATPVFEELVLRSDTLAVEVRERMPLALDGCSYEALEVEMRVERGTEGAMRLRYLYLPDLGAGFLLERGAEGEDGQRRALTGLAVRR